MQHRKNTRTAFVYDWGKVPVLVDVPLACAILGVSESGIKRLCASGEIPARKVGRMWRINRADLMHYLGAA